MRSHHTMLRLFIAPRTYPYFVSAALAVGRHDRKETCAWSRMPYVNTVSKSIVPRKGNWRPPCTQTPACSIVDAETVTPGGEKVLVCPSSAFARGTHVIVS